MHIRKWVCRWLGHKPISCENGCPTHGSCERCQMFWKDKGWFDSWKDRYQKRIKIKGVIDKNA